jgi:hypothetical protein
VFYASKSILSVLVNLIYLNTDPLVKREIENIYIKGNNSVPKESKASNRRAKIWKIMKPA